MMNSNNYMVPIIVYNRLKIRTQALEKQNEELKKEIKKLKAEKEEAPVKAPVANRGRPKKEAENVGDQTPSSPE